MVTEVAEDFDFSDFSRRFNPLYLAQKEAFRGGQQDILDKLIAIAQPWVKGKVSNEDFAKKLNELFNEYGKNNRPNVSGETRENQKGNRQ